MAMAKRNQKLWLLCALAVSALAAIDAKAPKPTPYSQPLNRTLFPHDFIFGAGTAAYQSEGASFMDGKGKNVWDVFTRVQPTKIADQSNGDVAIDFYHRYKEDIKLMKKVGLTSFRFSLAWARLFPTGKVSDGVNPLGVTFYNNLLAELLANDIIPFVTLVHYDTPQGLEDAYKSWLSPLIIKDYVAYVDFCFKTFGDRVKHWVTMNEPNGYAMNAYSTGTFAPGRCSNYTGSCPTGNSSTEPYLAAHHMILSHAAAAKLYREKYKPTQKGVIGITIVTHWFEPYDQTQASISAAARAHDFLFGWFFSPLTFGDYPEVMKTQVGDRLPKFTDAQKKILKGSSDFLGLNYYTGNYVRAAPLTSGPNKTFLGDFAATLTPLRNGVAIGTPTALNWLYIYPKGIQQTLNLIKEKYNDPIIYITENGMADNASLPMEQNIKDAMRIRYHHGHLSYLAQAIKDGVKVKGYYLWSFWDDFEWDAGYTVRFGITYIDYTNNLKRTLKYSAYWFKRFLLN